LQRNLLLHRQNSRNFLKMEFLTQNQILTILALAWTLPWKEVALWKAAKNDDKVWFVALFFSEYFSNFGNFVYFYFQQEKSPQKQ